MKQALAFSALSNFSSIRFSRSSTCLDHLRAEACLETEAGCKTEHFLSELYSLGFSEPKIFISEPILPHWLSVTQKDTAHPVWLRWVNSALSHCGCWLRSQSLSRTSPTCLFDFSLLTSLDPIFAPFSHLILTLPFPWPYFFLDISIYAKLHSRYQHDTACRSCSLAPVGSHGAHLSSGGCFSTYLMPLR